MGSAYTSILLPRHVSLFLALILFLWGSNQMRFVAEGRSVSKLLETGKIVGEEEEKALLRARIGSRPPRCERRCSTCGHCEAVQIPAVPQEKNSGKRHSSTLSTFNSGGQDSSNYKPMSWKCKCGDSFFNP